MPPGAVYVGRPTDWGNPYRIDKAPPMWPVNKPWNAAAAVECFALMLAGGWRLRRPPGFQIVTRAMEELEGKDLVCWCKVTGDDGSRHPCHADILLEYANGKGNYE